MFSKRDDWSRMNKVNQSHRTFLTSTGPYRDEEFQSTLPIALEFDINCGRNHFHLNSSSLFPLVSHSIGKHKYVFLKCKQKNNQTLISKHKTLGLLNRKIIFLTTSIKELHFIKRRCYVLNHG